MKGSDMIKSETIRGRNKNKYIVRETTTTVESKVLKLDRNRKIKQVGIKHVC